MKEPKNYRLVVLIVVIACVHDIILEQIFRSFSLNPVVNIKDYGIVTDIIAGLVLAPLLETMIFQYLPHRLLNLLNPIKQSKYFAIIYIFLSTMVFSFSHSYSWMYIMATVF